MAIPAKPVLSSPPEAPLRGEPSGTFSTKANALVAWLTTNVSDQNEGIDWQNIVYTEMGTLADNAATSAVAASDQVTLAAEQAIRAEEAATFAESLSNFKGQWVDLTGSLNVPAVVFHDNAYWRLLNNIADVTLSEPGVSADWATTTLGEPWLEISASGTLAAKNSYAVDFTAGPLTLTLPATPDRHDFVKFYRSVGSSIDSVVARNGQTIMAIAENLDIDSEITSVHLVFNGSDWRII